jgi:thymidine kinase
MDIHPSQNRGWIEVVTGTMFGGKSTELLRRMERALIAHQDVIAFSKDTRFEKGAITTHSEHSLTGHYVETAQDIDRILSDNATIQVIGIDEIQFFDQDLVDVCRDWALAGKRIICAGLDQDYHGEPFETTLGLIAEAEYVDKFLAICTKCGNPAVRNHLKITSDSRIVEGAGDLYEALCRNCFAAIS